MSQKSDELIYLARLVKTASHMEMIVHDKKIAIGRDLMNEIGFALILLARDDDTEAVNKIIGGEQ